MAVKYPSDFTALMATGYSSFLGGAFLSVASWAQQIANTLPSARFAGLQNGYITQASLDQTLQLSFFYYPFFSDKIKLFAQQVRTRQTDALGEIFTFFGMPVAPAVEYTKLVYLLNGNEDMEHCQGNCSEGDISGRALSTLFPAGAMVQKRRTGENINQHYSAGKVFRKMLDFVETLEG
ncbi:hypothetical protein ACMFMG_001363 [Clarireedia jacksonii]